MSKLKKQELEKIRESIKAINSLQMQIGGIEAQKHELLHSITKAAEEFRKIQEELEAEYGKVDIDITTGEIKEQDEPTKED